jgi:predicted CopG family antitoxin
MSVNDYEYQLLLNNAIRFLDKLTNCLLYNSLFHNLIHIHKTNIQVCEEYSTRLKETEVHKTNRKGNRKPKVKDEYLRSVSTDLFTGQPKYIYSNLKTGDEIISDNPDLLEELNKPKEKKKKATKVLSLPIGFSFKLNK